MLEQYKEQIRRAYYFISMNPDKRADSIIASYEPEYQSMPDERKARYLQLFLRWMSSNSRCASSMVTGPANFPVERNRKANRAADNAYEAFRKFVEKKERVPLLSPEDDLDKMIRQHADLVCQHEMFKKSNSPIRKYVNKKIEKDEAVKLVSEILKIKLETAEKWVTSGGYLDYQSRNNNASIRRYEERIKILNARIYAKKEFSAIEFDGGKIDIQDDRVLIIHDKKPDQTVIAALKGKGFHWAPSVRAWSRKHTAQAVWDAKGIVGIPQGVKTGEAHE